VAREKLFIDFVFPIEVSRVVPKRVGEMSVVYIRGATRRAQTVRIIEIKFER